MNYRELHESEILQLVHNGCSAEEWSNIIVAEGFNAEYLRNVEFSGNIKIGKLSKPFILDGGVKYHPSIKNVRIHNSEIGNDVYISGVANYISNYIIDDEVFIENVNRIECKGESSFGNGVQVSVLNEAGGREVTIYEGLNAHIAHMLAMYRYRPQMIARVNAMIGKFIDTKRSNKGYIGAHCQILNTNIIENVNIGSHTIIDGASRLANGTIIGSAKDPVKIGCNVMAQDFIVCSGARLEDGAVILHTFVGQGTHISHLFSAHDSLFFANCALENGEAAAIFAGPYTVSMHKSSLLIAGQFSFLNAGSGSNQSNHMYKLGPIHQGIVERGSKTTSDSYILWPAKIGAFSLVLGRHVSHPDTSLLPFSYLIENKGKSYLVPGVNLKSVGTIRDAMKWPKRDKRRDDQLTDYINFNLLSPYTIGRMMKGIDLLNTLEKTCGITADLYTYQSMIIEPRALQKGRYYYKLAIDKFMGNSLIHRLRDVDFKSEADIYKYLKPTNPLGDGEWVDMSGLILPKSEVSRLVDNIENGEITILDEIDKFFVTMHNDYYDMEWTWVVAHFKDWYGKNIEELTAEDIIKIVNLWQESLVTIDRYLYEDAKKEFSLVAKTGFGIDGCETRKEADFEQVRGEFEKDPFVRMVCDHIDVKTKLGNELISRVRNLQNCNND